MQKESMDTRKRTLNKNILSLFPIYLRNRWTLYFLFRASGRHERKEKKKELRKADAQTLNSFLEVEKKFWVQSIKIG
jgi:gamma-glutamylcysteine synthetase